MSLPIGPYMNEDGDWWVPVEVDGQKIAMRFAREEIIGCLQYNIPTDGTLKYVGKVEVWLDGEHAVNDCDHVDCPASARVLAWHFRENPRPWT